MTTNRPPMRWTVTTESGSAYHVDLRHKLLLREGGIEASGLRRDGQGIRIVAMTEPAVGECWCLVLDLELDSGALTTRITTRVISVEPAERGGCLRH